MNALRLTILGAIALPLAGLASACGSSNTSPGSDGGTDGSSSSSGGSGGSSGSSGSSGGSGGSSGSSGGSGGSSGGSGGSSGGSGGSSGSSGGSGGSSGGSSGSSSGGPMTDAQCAAEGGQSCNDCCAANHNDGYAVYVNAIIGCECGPKGACQAPCSTEFCMLVPQIPMQGDTCDNCISDSFGTDGGGDCELPVEMACTPGSTCEGYLTCSNGCM